MLDRLQWSVVREDVGGFLNGIDRLMVRQACKSLGDALPPVQSVKDVFIAALHGGLSMKLLLELERFPGFQCDLDIMREVIQAGCFDIAGYLWSKYLPIVNESDASILVSVAIGKIVEEEHMFTDEKKFDVLKWLFSEGRLDLTPYMRSIIRYCADEIAIEVADDDYDYEYAAQVYKWFDDWLDNN